MGNRKKLNISLKDKLQKNEKKIKEIISKNKVYAVDNILLYLDLAYFQNVRDFFEQFEYKINSMSDTKRYEMLYKITENYLKEENLI